MRAFVFPGQGSQKIGMGKEMAQNFSIAREVFEEVNDALSFDLFSLMTEGDAEKLNQTENAQPALMAVSLANLKVLEQEAGQRITDLADYVAGHSLGEYSALAAVGALSVFDTAKLLQLRGQAMQRAVPQGVGAMAAVLGLNFDEVDDLANEASSKEFIVVAANDNADGQVVLSGHKEAVEKAGELAKAKGAKRVLPLPVTVPSHSPLMGPAAEEMAEALTYVKFSPLTLPLVPNVIAEAISDIHAVPELLIKQLTGTVRWRETIQYLAQKDVKTIVEIGSGKVLSGMTKRIVKDLETFNIETKDDIDNYLKG